MKKNNLKTPLILTAAAAGLALALGIATPLLSAQADATLSNGGFCIVASSDGGKHTGTAGAKNCGEASETDGPPAEVEQVLIRQGTSVVVNHQASPWRSSPWTIVLTVDGEQPETFSGTTTASGYMSQSLKYDRTLPVGTAHEIKSYRIDFTIGSDSFSWTMPSTAFDTQLTEVDPITGEVVKPYLSGSVDTAHYGGIILFDIDGTWELPGSVTVN